MAPPPLRPPIVVLTAGSHRALLIASIISRAPGYDKPIKRPAPVIDPCDWIASRNAICFAPIFPTTESMRMERRVLGVIRCISQKAVHRTPPT